MPRVFHFSAKRGKMIVKILRGYYPWFYNAEHFTKKPILICFLTDKFAKKTEKLSDE